MLYGEETKRSTFGVRKSKVKVARRRRYIWRPCGCIILDPFGGVGFLVFYCHSIAATTISRNNEQRSNT